MSTYRVMNSSLKTLNSSRYGDDVINGNRKRRRTRSSVVLILQISFASILDGVAEARYL